MKRSIAKKKILVPVTIFAVLIISLIAVLHSVKKKMDNQFFRLISELKEGMPYSEAELIIGEKPQRVLTEPKDVEEWGPVKDKNITQECNLHMFLRTNVIPHRFILIYEDKKTHKVRYVTWKYT